MSDYLGNLLKRNQRTAAEIRPRPLARFESDPSGGAYLEVDGQTAADQSFESHAQSRPVIAAVGRTQDAPGKSQERVVDSKPTSTISPLEDVAYESTPPIVRGPVTDPLRTISVIDNSDAVSFETVTPSSPAKTGRDTSPDGLRLSPAPSADSQHLSTMEGSTPALPAPPTINVTIGRVEVRAVMPSQTRPKSIPQRPNPRLSLDDYLAKRKDGGQ